MPGDPYDTGAAYESSMFYDGSVTELDGGRRLRVLGGRTIELSGSVRAIAPTGLGRTITPNP